MIIHSNSALNVQTYGKIEKFNECKFDLWFQADVVFLDGFAFETVTSVCDALDIIHILEPFSLIIEPRYFNSPRPLTFILLGFPYCSAWIFLSVLTFIPYLEDVYMVCKAKFCNVAASKDDSADVPQGCHPWCVQNIKEHRARRQQ